MTSDESARQPRAAVQLYSLYGSDDSVPALVRRAGEAGFEGVEFAGEFQTHDPEEVADALEAAGVEAVSVHADLPTLEAAVAGDNDLLERCSAVGCDRVAIPHLSTEHYRTLTDVRALSARLETVAGALADHGVDLVHHTSRHEFWPILPDVVDRVLESSPLPDGAATYASRGLAVGRRADAVPIWTTGFWHLADLTDADTLRFELDVGEVAAARVDPVQAAALVSDRLSMVHISDVAPTGWLGTYGDVRTGEGTVDIDRVVEAATATDVEWLVYEDEGDRDPGTILEDGAALLGRVLGRDLASGPDGIGVDPTPADDRESAFAPE